MEDGEKDGRVKTIGEGGRVSGFLSVLVVKVRA